ncbi:MAG: ROK family protein [Labilithrix sp.]|nr:ROK family protein [Labilithrix sp.]MBX3224941.1 ROK family protein [Labilithrix sp.]
MDKCWSGASVLPLVEVDRYNEELRDAEGFIGDRASRRAFRAILDRWRARILEIIDEDPLGEGARDSLSKKKLDRVLRTGSPLAAGLLHTAIEDFSTELAQITLRFLSLKGWRDTERIVVGGGLSASRIGEVAIGRAAVLVKDAGHPVGMIPIRHHPDEAALIGAAHLAPSWIFRGSDAMLAVDIGGSNIRVGLVDLGLDKARDLSASSVDAFELWRYADERPRPKRDEAVARLVSMLHDLMRIAKEHDLTVAPLIGVACPGVIASDGSIKRGGQNLPGNWHSGRFNLAERLKRCIPEIGGHETSVIIHNDAVVQGLSEVPFMRDVERWAVLTIGTGLGNARFTNRRLEKTVARKAKRRAGRAAHGAPPG